MFRKRAQGRWRFFRGRISLSRLCPSIPSLGIGVGKHRGNAGHRRHAFNPDLLELFDTTTKLHATRVALRIERGKREQIYTYADLRELAGRVGVFLLGAGVAAGERVMLCAKNSP